MWSPSSPGRTDWHAGKIVPDTVLYYYDGPSIFSARIGLTEYLFYKIDEDTQAQLFLIAPVTARIITALQENTLSVRGAIAQAAQHWALEIAPDWDVRRYWSLHQTEIDELMPEHGLAMAPRAVPAADFIEQVLAFFSARFSGRELHQHRIPFTVFKALVDAAYDSFHRIFPPPVVNMRSLRRQLEFGLYQPKFSSLIIAIDEPSFDESGARRVLRQNTNLRVGPDFERNREDFFSRVGELVTEAERGDIRKSYAVEHFTTLYQVHDIVPTSSNVHDRVEFRSESQSLNPVAIDDRLGQRFRSAYKMAETEPRQITGRITDINEASGTMVITDEGARQTTCFFDRATYDDLRVSIGDKLRVRGKFKRRYRRDAIYVTGTPQVVE
jgi:hypothetical protein